MKKYLYITAIASLLIFSCKSQSKPDNTKEIVKSENAAIAGDTVRIANEELEYEVIIIDPGFTGWLATRARQRGYYSQAYLEVKNQQWVAQWNTRAMNPQQYGNLYLMQIDYRPQIDYGYEVNFLLYNYLVYFQQTNGQKLGGVVPQY
ncbi:hypothetical protein E0W68_05850 [Flavobacterium salilacus subsp. salilacus]|uniref:DUF6146 family protein n=1 Tax=Flavobacterium TaxID=237 RepID=UPI001074BA08|nr:MULTISPECIES: DUF6146 family protein [Flavobacterium]KAF2519286.1 hypothetical protein E0W68_05850 [Flavobacterium salilacus subsp. salilacus]MBE1613475.1 hypothetical protein [Flavobacterium sp. SaA2.13]